MSRSLQPCTEMVITPISPKLNSKWKWTYKETGGNLWDSGRTYKAHADVLLGSESNPGLQCCKVTLLTWYWFNSRHLVWSRELLALMRIDRPPCSHLEATIKLFIAAIGVWQPWVLSASVSPALFLLHLVTRLWCSAVHGVFYSALLLPWWRVLCPAST